MKSNFRLEGICISSLLSRLSDDQMFALENDIQYEFNKREKDIIKNVDELFQILLNGYPEVKGFLSNKKGLYYQIEYGTTDHSIRIDVYPHSLYNVIHSTDLFTRQSIINGDLLQNKLQEYEIQNQSLCEEICKFIKNHENSLNTCIKIHRNITRFTK
jgi:hypothetical protein